MGQGTENHNIIAHTQTGTGVSDYHFHRHRGDAGIDDPSPTFGQTDYEGLKAAARTSQAAFDSEASRILGSWYDNLATVWKQGLRDVTSRV